MFYSTLKCSNCRTPDVIYESNAIEAACAGQTKTSLSQRLAAYREFQRA